MNSQRVSSPDMLSAPVAQLHSGAMPDHSRHPLFAQGSNNTLALHNCTPFGPIHPTSKSGSCTGEALPFLVPPEASQLDSMVLSSITPPKCVQLMSPV